VVRRGLREDEDGIAQLMELNGMRRALAFEDLFATPFPYLQIHHLSHIGFFSLE
jgi:hypothetical protein